MWVGFGAWGRDGPHFSRAVVVWFVLGGRGAHIQSDWGFCYNLALATLREPGEARGHTDRLGVMHVGPRPFFGRDFVVRSVSSCLPSIYNYHLPKAPTVAEIKIPSCRGAVLYCSTIREQQRKRKPHVSLLLNDTLQQKKEKQKSKRTATLHQNPLCLLFPLFAFAISQSIKRCLCWWCPQLWAVQPRHKLLMSTTSSVVGFRRSRNRATAEEAPGPPPS